MHRALFIWLLITPAALSQTGGATAPEWDLIRACADNAAPDAIGLAQLEQVCPGLETSLAALGYDAYLSESQRAELSVFSLEDLVYLDTAGDVANAPLQTQSLQTVLESLEDEASEAPLSWWDRLGEWVRELVRRRADESSWLDTWLEKIQPSELVIATTVYSLVALVILLAILVVVNELRVAGVLKRRVRGETPAGSAPAGNARAYEALSIAELDGLPVEKRPAALLRIIVAALVRAGRLRSERSLTYRELARYARFPDDTQRESFERIARAAERSVYGASVFAEEDVALLVREGQALQERLAERAA